MTVEDFISEIVDSPKHFFCDLGELTLEMRKKLGMLIYSSQKKSPDSSFVTVNADTVPFCAERLISFL